MSRRAKLPPRHIGGFSLAEVLVVLVILGIVGAMTVPRLNLTPSRASAAASLAGSTLMSAQRAAVARQHDVVVAVDVGGRRLRVHFDADDDGRVDAGEWVRYEPLPEGAVFSRAGAPAGRVGSAAVSFRGRQDGLPAVTFLRNGSASEEGGFYLTSVAAAAAGNAIDARQVVVDRATGRLTWLTWDGSRWKTEF